MSQGGNYSPMRGIKNKDFELGGGKGHFGGHGLAWLSQGSVWPDLDLWRLVGLWREAAVVRDPWSWVLLRLSEWNSEMRAVRSLERTMGGTWTGQRLPHCKMLEKELRFFSNGEPLKVFEHQRKWVKWALGQLIFLQYTLNWRSPEVDKGSGTGY